MPRLAVITLAFALLPLTVRGASKPHVITFGKWTTVKWYAGADENHAVNLKVRPLLVDGRVKEFALDNPHEITDRLFVVQRAFRVNDSLPADKDPAPRWRWQRGGWLLVDRSTGRISETALPEFDANDSAASWYRDYAAYCGVSEDGKKLYAVIAQVGRRKPVLKKEIGDRGASEANGSVCPAPSWQRQPARVTFEPRNGPSFVYSVHGSSLSLVNDESEEGTD